MDQQESLEVIKEIESLFENNREYSIGYHDEKLIKEINTRLNRLEMYSKTEQSIGEHVLRVRESIAALFGKNSYQMDDSEKIRQINFFLRDIQQLERFFK